MSSVVLLVSLLLLHKMEECLKSAVVKSRKVDLSSNSIPVSVTALRCVCDQSAVRSNGFLTVRGGYREIFLGYQMGWQNQF